MSGFAKMKEKLSGIKVGKETKVCPRAGLRNGLYDLPLSGSLFGNFGHLPQAEIDLYEKLSKIGVCPVDVKTYLEDLITFKVQDSSASFPKPFAAGNLSIKQGKVNH